MGYATWSVVFGEQPSAAKWNILGTNDSSFNDGTGIAVSAIAPEKLLTGTGTSWPWIAWTPSWTNLTVNNGTVDAKYKQTGKTVNFRLLLTFGTTTSIAGNVSVSVPVTSVTYGSFHSIGTGSGNDSGSVVYSIEPALTSTTVAGLFTLAAAGASASYSFMTSTLPFTWGTGDLLMLSGTYEAA